jgi:hypothetical protein
MAGRPRAHRDTSARRGLEAHAGARRRRVHGIPSDAVKLEIAFLARSKTGEVYTPVRGGGRGEWPDGAFQDEVAQLADVRAKVVSLAALRVDSEYVQSSAVA